MRASILSCLLLSTTATLPATALATGTAPPARAAQETVAVLLERGRAALREGRAAEALELFQKAEQQDGATPRTRTWVLRAWIAQGRINDALEQIDALDRAGSTGAHMDYLYGMAFAYKAKGYIQEGVSGGIIQMAFVDAVLYLERATAAEPKLYADAFAPLAEAAWNAQKLPVARAAAEQACENEPRSAETTALLGRIALAQFHLARGEAARVGEAERHFEAASIAFARALELTLAAGGGEARLAAAPLAVELARTCAWKRRPAETAKAYAQALSLDPRAVDFNELREQCGAEFLAALEQGEKDYVANWGAENPGDATLLWWLGWARFNAKDHAGAEGAFQDSLRKWPEFVNARWYIALSRYYRQDYDGAVKGLKEHWDANREDLVAMARASQAENLQILAYLTGLMASARPPRNLEAAFLCELQAALEPTNSLHWNNLGLFLRDAGEALKRDRRKAEENKQQILELMERAYVAYAQALELAPDDPNYLNDTALMLHYHLDRDLERAREMYAKGVRMAEQELARKDLSASLREIRQIALRDNRNNLELIDKLLEQRRLEREEAARRKAGGEPKGGPPGG